MAKKKATTTPVAQAPVPATAPATPAPVAAPSGTPPAPVPSQPKRSYYDLDPLEEGGPIARKGFAYQDHVAAGKCLDMLLDGGPTQVWCEAEDDIVLVWVIQGEEWFEFVQVKSNELDKLWSLADLCKPGPATEDGPGACIIEKSLNHDRGEGKCKFRFVTCREPHSDLAPLKLALDHSTRTEKDGDFDKLVAEFEARLPGSVSPNGKGVGFWVRTLVWEHKATIRDIESENLVKLDTILHRESRLLAPDQKKELYVKLTQMVFDASLASGKTHKEQKRIRAAALWDWLLQQATEMARPASAGRSDVLEGKLKDAGYQPGTDEIETAKEQRRNYRIELLQPRFLDVGDRAVVEMEVQARLCRLKSQLDNGEFPDTGVQFHARCLKELEAMRDHLPTQKKPLVGLLYGLMYDIMNRCQHRLVRASV